MAFGILLSFIVLTFVNFSLCHIQDDSLEFLPKPEALIRNDDVIKVPLESGAELYTENKDGCVCPERNLCENLRCYSGVLCLNPDYFGRLAMAGAFSILLLTSLVAYITYFCQTRKPCQNLCSCCGTQEDRPDGEQAREDLQEVVSGGGTPRGNCISSGQKRKREISDDDLVVKEEVAHGSNQDNDHGSYQDVPQRSNQQSACGSNNDVGSSRGVARGSGRCSGSDQDAAQGSLEESDQKLRSKTPSYLDPSSESEDDDTTTADDTTADDSALLIQD